MALWWKSHYGSLTLEEMDSGQSLEAREVLRSEVITRNGNGKGQLRSDSREQIYGGFGINSPPALNNLGGSNSVTLPIT